MHISPSLLDRALRPLHRWIWADPARRRRKLSRFAETEDDGGRDLSRAAELAQDGLLRRLLLRHAGDEQRHAVLFRARARELPGGHRAQLDFFAPGERGLDDLRVDDESTASLLAFLHLSERAAAQRFAAYRDVLAHDPITRQLFERILQDEAFHMSYTRKQLYRLSPRKAGSALWAARAQRVWKMWLRIASGIADVLGTAVLLGQYFVLLPPFALLARRRPEPEGLLEARAATSFTSQY